jgi:Bacterial PH domain
MSGQQTSATHLPDSDLPPGGEYIRGIREPLPDGERVLWQGAPHWWALAVRAFHIRKVAVYFAALLAWRIAASLADGQTVAAALAGAMGLLAVAALGLGLLALLASLAARTTIYAITTRRVMLKIGIALPIFVNLPSKGIESAQLRTFRDGSGDLPLLLQGDVRLAYLHLWPHARPWQLAHPQPMLRGVRDPARVAAILQDALAADTPVPRSAQVVPLPARVVSVPREAPTTVAA